MNNIVRAFGIVFFVLVAWFIYSTLAHDLHIVRSLDPHNSVQLFVLATLLGLLALYFRVIAWKSLINIWLPKNTVSSSFYFWSASVSRMYRYIPGNIVSIGSRMWFARSFGLTVTQSTTVGIADMLLSIVSVSSITLLLIVAHSFRINQWSDIGTIILILILIIIVGVLLLFISPYIINTFLAKFRYKFEDVKEHSRSFFVPLVLNSVFHLTRGASFVIFVSIFGSQWMGNEFLLACYFTGIGLISMLAVFTVAGFGVYEVLLFIGLGLIYPSALIAIIVSATRIWDILLDLIFLCISYVIKKLGSSG